MFTSKLECSKFLGAKIKTASGIRGQVKKYVKEGPDGSFRATFEDKIIKSDIVFCRTWFALTLEKFYNPIVSFDVNRLMKTTWEMRKKYGLKVNKESGYKPIERPNKVFTPLIIPKKLEEQLPFKSRDKMMTDKVKKERLKEEGKFLKPVMGQDEKEAIFLIQRLKLIEKEKKKKKNDDMLAKRKWKENWKEGMEKDRTASRKKFKQEKFMKLQMEITKKAKMNKD